MITKMKTGFGRLCITPPLGIAMSGYTSERSQENVTSLEILQEKVNII